MIARRGEPAHSMYFVAAGEVEIVLKERAHPPRARAFLRRGRGAPPRAPLRHRCRDHANKPLGTRRPRSSCPDGARTARRGAYPRSRPQPHRPRYRHAARGYRDRGNRGSRNAAAARGHTTEQCVTRRDGWTAIDLAQGASAPLVRWEMLSHGSISHETLHAPDLVDSRCCDEPR